MGLGRKKSLFIFSVQMTHDSKLAALGFLEETLVSIFKHICVKFLKLYEQQKNLLSLESFPHNFALFKNIMHDFNMTKVRIQIFNSTFKKSQLLYFFSFNKLFFFLNKGQ